jgi:hypothetical protein
VVVRTDLDATFVHPRLRVSYSLRWVLVHTVQEHARHAGHADFLRERIDAPPAADPAANGDQEPEV